MTRREFRKDIRGRGASSNVTNRYDSLKYEATEEEFDNYADEKTLLKTEVLKDSSRTILSENKSPDIGFRFSVNAYRGCEHGCAYCYARPTHEYLGYSPGLDFESKIFVKEEAPKLLREALMKKSWEPQVIAMSGVTDCYQPLERKMQLTRGCLEVLLEFKNPVSMITKNGLILRDLDIFKEMAKYNGILIFISVTSLDAELARTLEPRTSPPQTRLHVIKTLADAGIPVGVNVAPCIPGLTDHEMPMILKAASEAGAQYAGYVPLRLPSSVMPIFEEWLEVHRPLNKQKVLNSVRDIRGGKLNDPNFGSRMRGEGPRADHMAQMFALYARKYNLNMKKFSLSAEHFQRPGDQLKFAID
ncbi:PA0069 family radical SAM protein [Bdellovibrio sp. 22V]|uniref:PA0069 family radical SAM protein n=1 Tax=Bdellovibrio sp. 22V TaxID=3044166 RepID=UPI00254365BC|nr:PA0069 family radical SAM protein [Bdellovibrio sp. 22V]WII73533.1 PA0069 family radical SAM protein [Bdellovibrio sp. 22V]